MAFNGAVHIDYVSFWKEITNIEYTRTFFSRQVMEQANTGMKGYFTLMHTNTQFDKFDKRNDSNEKRNICFFFLGQAILLGGVTDTKGFTVNYVLGLDEHCCWLTIGAIEW